jgi:hypothetical protein
MDLNNIVGFKAVDKNGNERQVTVDEMTELVSARIVSAASEISTFAAAAAAGTDEFEDQLPQSDTFSWLRTLDGSKNPTLTSSSAAAKVLGGLIPNSLGFLRGYNNPDSLDTNINGIYNIDESVQGTWPLYAHKYGVLVVLCSKSFGVAQIYISDGTENIYVRKSYNLGKTWQEWLLIKGVNIS